MVHEYHLVNREFLSFREKFIKRRFACFIPFLRNVLKHSEFQNNSFIWEFPVHKYHFFHGKRFTELWSVGDEKLNKKYY